MKTLYCNLGKSTEHCSDSYIQQMMSHQTHFVLMAMVAPLRKLYDVYNRLRSPNKKNCKYAIIRKLKKM